MSQGMTNAQPKTVAPVEGDKLSNWLAYPPARARIESALQPGLDVNYFLAQIEISFQHPDVRKCTPSSQFEAANKLALLGLLPSLKHAALIPRRAGNGFEIDVMPQWQGYKALMERHPSVFEVNAYLVHKVDTYKFEDGKMEHAFDPFDPKRVFNKVDDLVGGYVVITFRDGRTPKYHFCNADYIAKCMKCAQTDNVWKKWFEQQARKTCYRSCFTSNVIPMDPLVQRQMGTIIEHEDVLLQNNPNFEAPTGIPAATPPSRTQQMVQQLVSGTLPRATDAVEEPVKQPESQDSLPEDTSPNGDGELSDFQQAQADIEGATDPMACKAAYDQWKDEFTDGEAVDLHAIYEDKLKTYPTSKPKKSSGGQLPLNG
jgi:hypothetical protein